MKNGGFTIRRVKVLASIPNGEGKPRQIAYHTWQIRGWLAGRRIRQQFEVEAEARGALNRLQVQAANADGMVRSANTRLTAEQLAAAEVAFHRLGAVPLSQAVDWYLTTYRPPVSSMALEKATKEFQADRLPHISKPYAREYRRTLRDLCRAFPWQDVHAVKPAELRAHMETFKLGHKGWNNRRGLLHTFFDWCRGEPRRWCLDNPARPLPKFKVARGIPVIATAKTIADLFAYLETFTGGPRQRCKPGCLIPYFALCTFAGIRPAVPHGEAWKLGKRQMGAFLKQMPKATGVRLAGGGETPVVVRGDRRETLRELGISKDQSSTAQKLADILAREIDLTNGVIRIGPDVAKTKDLRQITIQPNLRAWLERYPLKKYPIILPNMQHMLEGVREKFRLSHDVLRHTFISMHVAKFKSLGSTALEAGNSEQMIKKHYLNLVTQQEAEAFWSIIPNRANV